MKIYKILRESNTSTVAELIYKMLQDNISAILPKAGGPLKVTKRDSNKYAVIEVTKDDEGLVNFLIENETISIQMEASTGSVEFGEILKHFKSASITTPHHSMNSMSSIDISGFSGVLYINRRWLITHSKFKPSGKISINSNSRGNIALEVDENILPVLEINGAANHNSDHQPLSFSKNRNSMILPSGYLENLTLSPQLISEGEIVIANSGKLKLDTLTIRLVYKPKLLFKMFQKIAALHGSMVWDNLHFVSVCPKDASRDFAVSSFSEFMCGMVALKLAGKVTSAGVLHALKNDTPNVGGVNFSHTFLELWNNHVPKFADMFNEILENFEEFSSVHEMEEYIKDY
jgi:hypothetical protein